MRAKTSILVIVSLCCVTSAFGADAPDFSTFYSLYKNYASQNDITITGDLTSTRLLSGSGANTTIIDGGGFAFNGDRQNGFTIQSGYTISLSNGGAFSASGDSATIDKSYNNFVNTQGAVFSNLGGNLTIENSAFSSNTASSRGGVIYQTSSGNLEVTNSVFSNNSVSRGSGGVLYAQYQTNASFDNVIFQNNSASSYGGVIFNDGTLNISNSTFSSNTASSGAAIYNSNDVTLNDVKFIGNTGTSDAGAIYTTGDMNLTNGIFENNSGETGGAIGNYGIIGDGLYAVISDSQFTGNSATYGGAIYNWDDIYVIDSSFQNNTAVEGGGAIFNLEELHLIANNNDITFSGNTSGGESNAIYSTGKMNMNVASDRSILFNDAITGSGEININSIYTFEGSEVPNAGSIILNADMSGFNGNVNIYNGTVQIAENGKFFSTDALNVSGGTLDIGTASINTNSATFGSGSTLKLSINDADTYGFVSANTFSISEEANLSVVLAPDAMGDNRTLRVHILHGDGALVDNFIPQINNNIYMFTQIGDGWYEVAQQNDFNDVIRAAGGTQNNLNTAFAWQDEPSEANFLEHEVYVRMDELLQTNAIEYLHALTALAPTPAPLLQIMSSSYTSRFASLIGNDNTDKYYIANGKLWASGFGTAGHLKGNRQYADFDMYGFGGAVGAEYSFNDLTLGASYMYQYDRIKSWARTIHAPTNGGGLYAMYSPSNVVLRTGVNMFYTDFNETKNVAGLQVLNNPSIYTYAGWADVGYKFASMNWRVTPRAGVRYTLMHRGSATDGADQTVASKDLHFLTTYGDMTIARENMFVGSVNLVPEISLGTSYDARADIDDSKVYINGQTYSTSGEKLPRWAFNGELKLRAIFNPIAEMELGGSVEMRNDYNNYMVNIRGVLRF